MIDGVGTRRRIVTAASKGVHRDVSLFVVARTDKRARCIVCENREKRLELIGKIATARRRRRCRALSMIERVFVIVWIMLINKS